MVMYESVMIRLPLTEKNLEIHTQQYPPCKEARRRHARLYVKHQQPFVTKELQLMAERTQEIHSLIQTCPPLKKKWYQRWQKDSRAFKYTEMIPFI